MPSFNKNNEYVLLVNKTGCMYVCMYVFIICMYVYVLCLYVYICMLCVFILVDFMLLDIFAVFTATTIAEHQFRQNPNNTAEDRFHWSPDVDVS